MDDALAVTVASIKNDGILSDYYLPPGADPGNIISTVTLNGNNYERWAKVMRNAFHAKNKLNFIDGILQRPSPGTDLYKLWGIINSMMVAWILNTIDPELRSSRFMFQYCL
ncbi:hypothetical protein V5N11_025416 [Cardamine amara subsp. amara]|uniref:Retrotransposon Copia-like N-terminal domain-containing protein n=1 Tax=Cardamine amara subsp. amara TaxID=228776 RepID=A0ABD0ZPW9_CARAN